MKLYQQLILFMLAATVLPLAVVGFLLLSSAEKELAERIAAEQRALALSTAESVDASLMKTVDAMAFLVEFWKWDGLTEDEIDGALKLIYSQSSAVSAVLRLSSQGELLGRPIYPEKDEEVPAGHPRFDPASLNTLVQAVPVNGLRLGDKGQAALGRVYAHSLSQQAAVAVAIKLDEGERAPFVLAEVVFQDLEKLLAHKAKGTLARIDLVDSSGRILASSEPSRRLKKLEDSVIPLVRPAGTQLVHSFRTAAPDLRVSAARVSRNLDFDVVVSLDEAAAMAPVRIMRQTVLMSIGGALAVLLALGALYTRRINQRLSAVVGGVEAFSRGELDRRVQVDGNDEITALATTFNHMGAELETARAKLQGWNAELRRKIEEATAELKVAQ
ncbi:MAG TPA: HAMP domain-containing protein, partial [Myxococcaceae bacterium]